MNSLLVIGRIAFVLIFILSGAQKLMDIPGTAALIEPRVAIPELIAPYSAQLETATSMKMPSLLAIAAGIIEIASALMIALGFGTRFAAVVLILFTAAATYYFHAFWNMEGAARTDNMINALKNLSLIGGLLVLFVLGSWRPVVAGPYDEAQRL
ncbi:MAG: DoxX family protein [Pseudorhodoplanes sp.]